VICELHSYANKFFLKTTFPSLKIEIGTRVRFSWCILHVYFSDYS
jgi:hypothetical protein